MRDIYLYEDCDILKNLLNIKDKEMFEDIDLLCELTGIETGRTGIAYFVPEQERTYNIDWANEIRSGSWIKRNWNTGSVK